MVSPNLGDDILTVNMRRHEQPRRQKTLRLMLVCNAE